MEGRPKSAQVPLPRILPVVRDAQFKDPEKPVVTEDGSHLEGQAGIVALYDDRFFLLPGVSEIPAAAYLPEGADELLRIHSTESNCAGMPIDQIGSIELQTIKVVENTRAYGEDAVGTSREFDGHQLLVRRDEERVAIYIPDEELRHLVVAFDTMLGDRFSAPPGFVLPADRFIDLDPADQPGTEPDTLGRGAPTPEGSWRSMLIGLMLLGLGVPALVVVGVDYLPEVTLLRFESPFKNLAIPRSGAGLLVSFGVFAVFLGSKLWRRDARLVLQRDRRPPVLFLRSFSLDAQPLESSTWGTWGGDVIRFFMFLVCLVIAIGIGTIPFIVDDDNVYWSSDLSHYLSIIVCIVFAIPYAIRLTRGQLHPSYELALRPVLRRLGPYVAVGRPAEWFAPKGADRIYVGDDWQEVVCDLAGRSQLVVLQISPTRGTWWELIRIVHILDPTRLLLIVSTVSKSRQFYEEFRINLEDASGIKLPIHLDGASFFHFDEDWTPNPIRLIMRPFWLWPFVDCFYDLRRSLQPILNNSILVRHSNW